MKVNRTTINQESERGSTTVEAAIIVLPFFLIIFGIINLAILAFESISFQYALNKSARWGILGYTVEDPQNPGEQLARGQSIVKHFKEQADSLTLGTADIEVYFCPVSDPGCSNQGNPPGSQQWVVVRAEKPAKSFFGVGTLALSASVLTRNEPF